MSIEGRVISKVGSEAHIKQFFTGYVYKCDTSKMVVIGTTDDGFLIGKISHFDGKIVHW